MAGKYEAEVIAKGEFLDTTAQKDGTPWTQWKIETATVRINVEMHNAWLDAGFEKRAEWLHAGEGKEEARKQVQAERDELRAQMAKMAGLEGAGCVKQVVSEIFSIVRMTKVIDRGKRIGG